MKYSIECVAGVGVVFLSIGLLGVSDGIDVAKWEPGESGEWTVHTNDWLSGNDTPLPSPGYPGSNHTVGIAGGCVSVASQDVAVCDLYMSDGSLVVITDGRTFSVTNMMNSRVSGSFAGCVNVESGVVNIGNGRTGAVCGLSFVVGTNNTVGGLAFGDIWQTTNNCRLYFGTLDGVVVCVRNGGMRINAGSVTMRNGCVIRTYGQEVNLRGNWANTDPTTQLYVVGKGTGTIDIAGDLCFGGCALTSTMDTNGVALVQVGGDAILSNTVLTIGATDTLTNLATSYDLLRVPADKTITTNGMSFNVSSNGGFTYTVSVQEDRDGYDYLVVTPVAFLPSVTITNPVNESYFTAVTNITVSASTVERGSSITKVEFYANTDKIGEATNAPYSVGWSNVYAGCYKIEAIVSDAAENKGLSPTVNVNVQGAAVNGRRVFITKGVEIDYDPGCAE